MRESEWLMADEGYLDERRQYGPTVSPTGGIFMPGAEPHIADPAKVVADPDL
jgi:hypothetical protein